MSDIAPDSAARGTPRPVWDDAPVRDPVAAPMRKTRTFALPRPLGLALKGGGVVAVWGGMAVLALTAVWGRDLPAPDTLWTPNRPVSVQIVDRLGRDLLVRGAQAGAPVKIETLPPHIADAILATEDRRFYKHVGVDPVGLTRAAFVNLRQGRVVQGGSTLTQQLTKNVFLSPDQTFKRKVQEMILSLWLEHKFTKAEILNMYANRVYFGSGTWGLSAAAKSFFDKSPEDLTLGEAALLAGVLKAPSRYNPLSSPERAGIRTATVLQAMQDYGVIDRTVQFKALTEPIHIRRRVSEGSVNYFVDWIWDDLEARIGPPHTDIVVQTTLDRNMQVAAHAALNTHLDADRFATQGAVVALDGTGGVRTMVGGQSYLASQFNRTVQAQRQPGSAFKPFVYLAAFEKGLTPWDIRDDTEITLEDWTPKNFTDKFLGHISLEHAFGQSINTVAVRLQEEIGRAHVVETSARFGLTGLEPLRSLALGAQDTTPLALTTSYLPFANWGQAATPYGILSVSTADGTPLYTHRDNPSVKIIDNHILAHMNRIMHRTIESGTGRAARLTGRQVGGKTGTTNDFRDAWFVGYVPDLVTGVWVGNDDYTPMTKITGGSIPARIFKDVMTTGLTDQPVVPLPMSQPPLVQKKEQGLNNLLDDIESALP